MKRFALLTMGIVLVFALSCLALAASQAKGKAPATHQAEGTISSMDESSLVLAHKVKGKEEQTTFVINSATKKEGKLATGVKATVHYTVEGSQNVATVVKAHATTKK